MFLDELIHELKVMNAHLENIVNSLSEAAGDVEEEAQDD